MQLDVASVPEGWGPLRDYEDALKRQSGVLQVWQMASREVTGKLKETQNVACCSSKAPGRVRHSWPLGSAAQSTGRVKTKGDACLAQVDSKDILSPCLELTDKRLQIVASHYAKLRGYCRPRACIRALGTIKNWDRAGVVAQR